MQMKIPEPLMKVKSTPLLHKLWSKSKRDHKSALSCAGSWWKRMLGTMWRPQMTSLPHECFSVQGHFARVKTPTSRTPVHRGSHWEVFSFEQSAPGSCKFCSISIGHVRSRTREQQTLPVSSFSCGMHEQYRGTSLRRKCNPLGPYRRPLRRVLECS